METVKIGTIIKIAVFIILCIIAMRAGYEYGEYHGDLTTSVESREWDHSERGYRVREVTRNGFGNIVESNYYIER